MEMTIREKRLLEVAAALATEGLNEVLLEMCADLQYRMCLIELGITQF